MRRTVCRNRPGPCSRSGASAQPEDTGFSVHYLAGAYGKLGWYRADRRIGAAVLFGYSAIQASADSGPFSVDESGRGRSLGLVLEFFANEEHGVTTEYVRFLDEFAHGFSHMLDYAAVAYVRRYP